MNEEISQLARRSRHSAVIIWFGALLVIASLIYASVHLNSMRQEVVGLEVRRAGLQSNISDLEDKLAKLNRLYDGSVKELNGGFQGELTTPQLAENVNREGVLDALQGRRRDAIKLAFELYDDHVPFKWGGKNPADGLDTSGFVAYILNKVGVLNHPERYWSGLLLETFRVRVDGQSDLSPGDLVFEENKACWFVLNEHYTIGMVPGGIMIGDPTRFSSKIIGYGKVPYDRPAPVEH